MKLRFEEIKTITHGVLRIWEEEGFVHFSRFHEAEMLLYKNYSQAYCPAGVQMEFVTDATSLTLDVSIPRNFARSFFAFEVFANGCRVGILRNFADEDEEKDYPAMAFPLGDYRDTFALGEGEKRIQIFFPYNVEVRLRELSLDGGTKVIPVKRERTIVMYGDSITHGFDSLYPSLSYAVRIGEHFQAEIINKGIGGERFRADLASIRNEVTPACVTSAYGTNDWSGMDRQTLEKNCRDYYAALAETYRDTTIFAISPIWRLDGGDVKPFGTFEELTEMIAAVAAEHPNIRFIRGAELVPGDPALFGDRRIHPSARGFAYMAQGIIRQMEEAGFH